MSGVGDFFRWWGSELRSFLPGGNRSSGRKFDALTIDLSGDVTVLGRVSHRRPDTLTPLVSLEPGADSHKLVETLRRQFSSARSKLEIRVPAAASLSRDVDLPLAAEENLRGVVGFEMERLTPFRVEDVFYDATTIARDPSLKQLKANIRLVPSREVEPALRLFAAAGIEPERARTEITGNGDVVTVGFAPARREGSGGRAFGTLLIVVNLALLVAVAVIPLLQQREALAELDLALRGARAKALQVDDVQRKADALRGLSRQLVAVKSKVPTNVELLEEVALRLPDSTWIVRFEHKGGKLQISGTSDAAASLIEVLEASPLLADVQSRQVTTEAASGRDRFNISARVVKPEPRAAAPGGEDTANPGAASDKDTASARDAAPGPVPASASSSAQPAAEAGRTPDLAPMRAQLAPARAVRAETPPAGGSPVENETAATPPTNRQSSPPTGDLTTDDLTTGNLTTGDLTERRRE